MYQPGARKRIIITTMVFVALLFGLFISVVLNHSGKAAIRVAVLPTDSTLTVDGKKAKAGTLYLTKTTHTLTASRPPFSPIAKTINFATYNASQTLYLEPLPKSAQALQYLLNHPDIQAQREAASGIQAGETQQLLNKDKLVSLLPYTGPGGQYIVDYGSAAQQDNAQEVTIYIEADTDQAKQNALNWITSQKVDPKTLQIVYESLPANSSLGGNGGSEYQ